MIRRIVLLALALLTLAPVAAHAADTTIPFTGLGRRDRDPRPVRRPGRSSATPARSGSPSSTAGCTPTAPFASAGAAALGYCGGAAEFPHYASSGAFSSFRSKISMKVRNGNGLDGGGEAVTLRVYDVRRVQITSAEVPLTATPQTLAITLGTPRSRSSASSATACTPRRPSSTTSRSTTRLCRPTRRSPSASRATAWRACARAAAPTSPSGSCASTAPTATSTSASPGCPSACRPPPSRQPRRRVVVPDDHDAALGRRHLRRHGPQHADDHRQPRGQRGQHAGLRVLRVGPRAPVPPDGAADGACGAVHAHVDPAEPRRRGGLPRPHHLDGDAQLRDGGRDAAGHVHAGLLGPDHQPAAAGGARNRQVGRRPPDHRGPQRRLHPHDDARRRSLPGEHRRGQARGRSPTSPRAPSWRRAWASRGPTCAS